MIESTVRECRIFSSGYSNNQSITFDQIINLTAMVIIPWIVTWVCFLLSLFRTSQHIPYYSSAILWYGSNIYSRKIRGNRPLVIPITTHSIERGTTPYQRPLGAFDGVQASLVAASRAYTRLGSGFRFNRDLDHYPSTVLGNTSSRHTICSLTRCKSPRETINPLHSRNRSKCVCCAVRH